MCRKCLFLLFLAGQTCLFAQEYYPEGTKWTEIRLDTMKYESWYSMVDDEWIPNFETIDYSVKGEYVEKRGDDYDIFKKVYSNGPEWTDSLAFLIQEGDEAENIGCDGIIVTVLTRAIDGEPSLCLPGVAYQFDWSVGKGLYYKDILMSNTTFLYPFRWFYGIIEEIKEGFFGGVKPLKYVNLDGKAPVDSQTPGDYDTNGGCILQGIGITEWNDGECLFGAPNPYGALSFFNQDQSPERHYRSMLVHFERNGEVLYDVWPEKNDADGIKTICKQQSLVDEMLYSPDGKRLPAPQRGLNIVRTPDGTMKKVFMK